MLNTLSEWYETWQLAVNGSKTKLVHFGPSTILRADFQWQCGIMKLEAVDHYLTEHLGVLKNGWWGNMEVITNSQISNLFITGFRDFWGVRKKAPTAAGKENIGCWVEPQQRQCQCIARKWSRFMHLPESNLLINNMQGWEYRQQGDVCSTEGLWWYMIVSRPMDQG